MSDLFVHSQYVFLMGKQLPIPTLPYPTHIPPNIQWIGWWIKKQSALQVT